jgi:WD40 repeat protein
MTGQETLTLKDAGGISSAPFSPDGRRLAYVSAGGTVKVWDARPLDEEPVKPAS